MRKIFESKLFRKITIGIIAALAVLVPLITVAQMGGGISVPQYFKRVGTALQPTNTAWTLGSSGTPLANGYFTALTAGTLTISSTVSSDLSVDGVIKASAGTAAAPSYTFTRDPNTGFYSYGTDIIGVSVNGGVYGVFAFDGFRAGAFSALNGTAVKLTGRIPDGATAIGVKIGNDTAITTAGAKIVSFYSDNAMTEKAYIDNNGLLGVITGNTRTTIGANGGATALTALPVGYFSVNIAGTEYQVPYYNKGA